MARRPLLFVGLLAFSLAAVACGGTAASPTSPGASMRPQDITGTIRLLSYSDGFDPGYMASFHQEYPNINLETAAWTATRPLSPRSRPGSRSTS